MKNTASSPTATPCLSNKNKLSLIPPRPASTSAPPASPIPSPPFPSHPQTESRPRPQTVPKLPASTSPNALHTQASALNHAPTIARTYPSCTPRETIRLALRTSKRNSDRHESIAPSFPPQFPCAPAYTKAHHLASL